MEKAIKIRMISGYTHFRKPPDLGIVMGECKEGEDDHRPGSIVREYSSFPSFPFLSNVARHQPSNS